jgi:hypothetical protein
MFIPNFHFDKPEDKLKAPWCMKVVNYHVKQQYNPNLLHGKNIKEIEEFSSGDYDLSPFIRMFKSTKKKMQVAPKNPDGSFDFSQIMPTGIKMECVPLLPTKLNSAVATVQKVPIEPIVTAQDGLAMQKKQDDLTFLQNKPFIEADLQDLADQMQIGPVDLGTTQHSFKKFSDTPFGLDLNDPGDKEIFVKLIYSLSVETAFEKVLSQIYHLLKADQVRLLETRDQLKYAVSCDRSYLSATTGLPNVEYIYPGRIRCPFSQLPDYSDRTHTIIDYYPTPFELFNLFGNEICDEDMLQTIVNGEGNGYCSCNRMSNQNSGNWNNFKMNLQYIEVKSIDSVGVVEKRNKNSKRSIKYFTAADDPQCTDKVWAQNTYGFYWLTNTQYIFGIHRLDHTHRTKGQESYQNFSSNIYKSQVKSAVELSIPENKNAQIAWVKLQHCLVKSMPPGSYVDLKFLRNALTGLKKEGTAYTIDDLITMVYENNQMIGDSEGFDGKNDGQLKPYMPMPGGLPLAEVSGYVQTILNADQNISTYTGINQPLTGQSPDPNSLVGLQKLAINASLNAIYYVTDAIRTLDEAKFTMWCGLVQECIKQGGKTKDAIINWIGVYDTNVIEGLGDASLHDLTCKVTVGQREVERAKYEARLNFFVEQGIITAADEYILSGIENPKERFAALASLEKRFMKKQDQIRQEGYAAQQQNIQATGQNQMQTEQVKNENAVKQIYAKGDVQAKLLQLAASLGLNSQQTDGLIKSMLQSQRSKQQTAKSLLSINAQANATAQNAAVA